MQNLQHRQIPLQQRAYRSPTPPQKGDNLTAYAQQQSTIYNLFPAASSSRNAAPAERNQQQFPLNYQHLISNLTPQQQLLAERQSAFNPTEYLLRQRLQNASNEEQNYGMQHVVGQQSNHSPLYTQQQQQMGSLQHHDLIRNAHHLRQKLGKYSLTLAITINSILIKMPCGWTCNKFKLL